jgi:hypothetical protein
MVRAPAYLFAWPSTCSRFARLMRGGGCAFVKQWTPPPPPPWHLLSFCETASVRECSILHLTGSHCVLFPLSVPRSVSLLWWSLSLCWGGGLYFCCGDPYLCCGGLCCCLLVCFVFCFLFAFVYVVVSGSLWSRLCSSGGPPWSTWRASVA